MEWLAVNNETIRKKVLDIVKEGALRLTEPEKIRKDMIELIEARKAAGSEYVPWSPLDLARGFGGLCILFGGLDRAEPEAGWDEIGHRYLQEIQAVLAREGAPGPGLWSGLAGVVMAARALSRDGQRYATFIEGLNSFFLKGFPGMLQFMESRLEQGAALHEFDVIQGMSGIGRYLLCFAHKQEMCLALKQVLNYLVGLCEDRRWDGESVPGWFTTPENQHLGHDRQDYPNGHLNCGMSHGIPGVLALMAVSIDQGIEVAGQREAMYKIGCWLMKWKGQDEFGPLWPPRVTWEENLEGRLKGIVPREAWCYGGPGVARALWLSGVALDCHEWKHTALDTYRGTALRPEGKWNIESDTFCHGRAGLLQMVQRMYSESGDKFLEELRDRLLIKLLEKWNPEEPYGYHEAQHSDRQHLTGLLDGAAGVLTVLHGLVQEYDSDWDSLFLIC